MPLSPTQLQDFLQSTSQVYFQKNRKNLINSAVLNGEYVISGKMLAGRTMDDIVRGGTSVTDPIMLNEGGSFGSYVPGQTRTITPKNVLARTNFKYRSYKSDAPYTTASVQLNEKADMEAQLKNLKSVRNAQIYTDHCNGLERLAWAKADSANMEDAASLAENGKMLSINAFITEDNPAWQSWAPGWTASTVGGVARTEVNWRNAVYHYTNANRLSKTSGDGIINGFDRMRFALSFSAPAIIPGMETTTKLDQGMLCITNRDGMEHVTQLIRLLNDGAGSAQGNNMGINEINYNGCRFIYHAPLDTAEINQTRATSSVASVYATAAGRLTYQPGEPRFFFVNPQVLKPVFVNDCFMSPQAITNGGNQAPDLFNQEVWSWLQLICLKRNGLGVVAPLTTTTS